MKITMASVHIQSESAGSIRRPIAATIAAFIKGESVLLVRRANPPDAGRWGFPGGKIEFGEMIGAAAIRELFEETGIVAEAGPVFTAVDALDGEPGAKAHAHYVLIAVLCRWLSGEPEAGDDALEAAWHDLDGLEDAGLAMSFGVAEVARQAAALAAFDDDHL
ncbi:NUDIX hydrolase [Sphingomonas morindae]|uniref:NUDIX hydrolase n=1 Tax=Sphingomonas morindae TaxID=1541170 RepID=A0ABY4X404_9SPHN|nr:NUDIX hydrolase [Sphingomonas morindae]USI71582.1 NUDIX hydrolase [Sphingomonas morindae]